MAFGDYSSAADVAAWTSTYSGCNTRFTNIYTYLAQAKNAAIGDVTSAAEANANKLATFRT